MSTPNHPVFASLSNAPDSKVLIIDEIVKKMDCAWIESIKDPHPSQKLLSAILQDNFLKDALISDEDYLLVTRILQTCDNKYEILTRRTEIQDKMRDIYNKFSDSTSYVDPVDVSEFPPDAEGDGDEDGDGDGDAGERF